MSYRIVTLTGRGLPANVDADGYDTREAADAMADDQHRGAYVVLGDGDQLRAHAGPTGARDREVDEDEAREIATEDPALVYVVRADLARRAVADLARQDRALEAEDPIGRMTQDAEKAIRAWRKEAAEAGDLELAKMIDALGIGDAADVYEAARAALLGGP